MRAASGPAEMQAITPGGACSGLASIVNGVTESRSIDIALSPSARQNASA